MVDVAPGEHEFDTPSLCLKIVVPKVGARGKKQDTTQVKAGH